MRAPAALAFLLACTAASAQDWRGAWDFDVVRRADGRPLQNVYWASMPLDPWIPDAADSSHPTPCVGDAGGPTIGDGNVDSDDLLCHWWTSGQGTFVVAQYVPSECRKIWRVGTNVLGRRRLVGQRFDLDPGAGIEVHVAAPDRTPAPRNHAELEGDEPPWAGRVIRPRTVCPAPGMTQCCPSPTLPWYDLLHVPHDTLLRDSFEILCGLEGVDWVDDTGPMGQPDGKPDTCWDDADGDGAYDTGEALTGLFDGRTAVSVAMFENALTNSAAVSHGADMWRLGVLRFPGFPWAVEPGRSYRVLVDPSYRQQLWDPPRP